MKLHKVKVSISFKSDNTDGNAGFMDLSLNLASTVDVGCCTFIVSAPLSLIR